MGTVPSPSTETTGVATTAAQLNSDIRDATNFLLAAPNCVISTFNTTTVPSSTTPGLISTWGASPIVMNDNQWAGATPSRLTAKTPGLYEISLYLHLNYVAYTGTQMAHCGLTLNNAGGSWFNGNQLAEDTRVLSAISSLGTSISLEIEYFLNVGDYVEAYTTQTSGSSTTIGSGAFSAAFGIRWVGSQ